MKEISFESEHRKKHFEFFNTMNHPYFNITGMLDIQHFYKRLKELQMPFTPALVYIITRAINEIKEFRWRIRDGRVIEHDVVHPSYTILPESDDVFSFCYVKFNLDHQAFIEKATIQMKLMESEPSFEDEAGRDDFIFMSANPWIHFTSMQHAMQSHPGDSVPRIVWGKFLTNDGRLDLPFSVQVHHAVVDGQHVGHLFKKLQGYFDETSWLD